MEREYKVGDKVYVMGGPAQEDTITEIVNDCVKTKYFGNTLISKKSLRTDDDNDWFIEW